MNNFNINQKVQKSCINYYKNPYKMTQNDKIESGVYIEK